MPCQVDKLFKMVFLYFSCFYFHFLSLCLCSLLNAKSSSNRTLGIPLFELKPNISCAQLVGFKQAHVASFFSLLTSTNNFNKRHAKTRMSVQFFLTLSLCFSPQIKINQSRLDIFSGDIKKALG